VAHALDDAIGGIGPGLEQELGLGARDLQVGAPSDYEEGARGGRDLLSDIVAERGREIGPRLR
jgi:hypothetical protein